MIWREPECGKLRPRGSFAVAGGANAMAEKKGGMSGKRSGGAKKTKKR